MYGNLLQNWRGWVTLKEKLSSSPCQISLRDFILPLHFKSLQTVGLPASTMGVGCYPGPRVQTGRPTDSRDSKNFRAVIKWDFYFLLLIFLFRDTKRFSHWSNPGRGYTLKKSSCRLVDKEIFLTHLAKLCLLICNKCIVIYYKIEGEGLPAKRSFLCLLANKTKKYLFEGTRCPCILSLLNQLVCLLAPCPLGASRQTNWFKGLKKF